MCAAMFGEYVVIDMVLKGHFGYLTRIEDIYSIMFQKR